MKNLLSEEWLNSLPDPVIEHYQALNKYVIQTICKRIKSIGELSVSDLDKIKTAAQYAGADVGTIEREIKKTAGLVDGELEQLYNKVIDENIEYANEFYVFRGKEKLTADDAYIQRLVNAAKKRTAMSKMIGFKVGDRVVPIRDAYIKTIDRAVYFAQSGVVDYNTAIRSAVKDIANSGLRRVTFESGYTRRLDSQARMNILDGVRELNAGILQQAGEEFGADGYEISAHALCAPDHIDIQGRQYSKKEYEALQESLERPIGTMNCHHFATPIILGVSEPTYSKKELAELRKRSQEQIEYNEKKYTRYEASQEQRRRETAIRYAKDRRDALKVSGDEIGAKQENKKAREMIAEYKRFSESVGLTPRLNRTR